MSLLIWIIGYLATEFDVLQPKCPTIPHYEKAHGTKCDKNYKYTSGETCKIQCKKLITMKCSCTQTLGGIITVLRPDGCHWVYEGHDCGLETQIHTAKTHVETNAKTKA